MAARGAKPIPSHLRLVSGRHRDDRHGNRAAAKRAADATIASFGKLKRPKLKARAAAAWQQYIEPATWLDGAREPAAIAFCELWSEFRDAPGQFVAAKHAQMRAYMSELGLTDERARSCPSDDSGKDEFF